ncbi:hypothetical protein [Acidocella aromatica]|uniref:hypothetical protein n=1 Tax=Acidocella aromatica TaxID=1303579 RepID=UPI0031B5D7F3
MAAAEPEAPGGDDIPPRSGWAYVVDLMLGRVSTLLVASTALLLGLASFGILAGRVKLSVHSGVAVGMIIADFAALLMLIVVLAGRVTRILLEHRRGAAGGAAACASCPPIRRRGGGAGHRGGGVRHRILQFRHPGLVQPACANGTGRE